MKIVINALQLKQNSSGIGVMIRELFGPYAELTKRICKVILPHDGPAFPCCRPVEIVRIPWNYQQNIRRIFFQTFQLGRRYGRNAVLLTTDSKVPLLLPKSCIVIPLITDLAVYEMQEVYQLSRVIWWRLQYRYLCHRADLFLTISEFTKRDMIAKLHISPEKIKIVPCACSPQMRRVDNSNTLKVLREKYHLPGHFVLFVGNFNPRKNLERLIQAFDQVKSNGNIKHHLVIAGEQGWKFDRDKALEGVLHREAISFIGFVADEDMPALYTAADLFAFPTLYEGFGIPVIEAQTCGTPVLTSNCSALPEVGGDAAIYVDPYSVDHICEGMLKILNSFALQKQLAEKGYQNAKRFSWAASAKRLHEIIEEEIAK